MERRVDEFSEKAKTHPFARILLGLGEGRLTGNLAVICEDQPKTLVFLIHKGLLLKATGLMPLEFFAKDLPLSPIAKGDPYAHELPTIKKLLKNNPPRDVWWWVASQASSTLLGVRTIAGKKKARFFPLEPKGVNKIFLDIGAGIRLNERVAPLFFPNGTKALEEEQKALGSPSEDWDWEGF